MKKLGKAFLNKYGTHHTQTDNSNDNDSPKKNFTTALSIYRISIQDGIPLEIPKFNNLYIGGIGSLLNTNVLKSLNITHIICATDLAKIPYQELNNNVTILRISLTDQPNEIYCEALLNNIIPITNTFIKSALDKNSRVLVHCFQGKSRATSIIIAYMLYINNINSLNSSSSSRSDNNNDHDGDSDTDVNDCLDLIRQVRPNADPNSGFIETLKKYFKKLKAGSKVK